MLERFWYFADRKKVLTIVDLLQLDRNPITPSFATVLLEGIHKAQEMVLEELGLQVGPPQAHIL